MARCPLPSHKPNDKDKNFSMNVEQNYWRCFSDSCNAANGGKRDGDVINLVALLENCTNWQAPQKIAEWCGLNRNGDRQATRCGSATLSTSQAMRGLVGSRCGSCNHAGPGGSQRYSMANRRWKENGD